MVSVDPSQYINDPLGANLGGEISGGNQGLPPLYNNKPNALKALNNKWAPAQLQAMQSQYGKDATNQLVQWEFQRAQRGISPVAPDATIKMLQQANQKNAVTPAPSGNPLDVLGNIASDAGQIASGIVKAPQQIASDIIHSPETLNAIGTGDPSKILQAPLIRLIPGAYTAGNLLQGNFNEIASHPLMSALDVAPYAGLAGVPGMVSKIPVGETTVGELGSRAQAAFGRTLPGQLAQETFGSGVRDVQRTLAGKVADVNAAALPQMANIFQDGLSQLRQKSTVAGQSINQAITPERMPVIQQALEDPAALGAKTPDEALSQLNATDAELGAVRQYRDARDAYTQYGIDTGNLFNRVVNGQTETFNASDARKIDRTTAVVQRAQTLTNLREAVLNPTTADFGQIHDDVMQTVSNQSIPVATRRSVANGYVHALDAAGYDTGSMLADISHASGANIPQLVQAPGSFPQMDEGTLRTRRITGQPGLSSPDRWLEANRAFTPKRLAKVQENADAIAGRTVPAQWQPAYQRIKVDVAKNYVEQKFSPDDPAVPKLLDQINGHMYGDLGQDAVRQINSEVLGQISALRDQGYAPEFVHHVSPEQERALASPTITTIVPKATQYGNRINDWTPSSNSLSVSLNHQGLELARQAGSREALDTIRDAHTVSVRDAEAGLRPVAERAAVRRGTDYGTELERLMKKQYVRWSETENGFMAGNAKGFKFTDASFRPDELLVERPIANSLKMLASPPAYSRIFDPYMKVFRTAILPFSPRFLVHHIGGGMVSQMLEDPRILAKIPEGMKFSRDLSAMNKAMADGRNYELSDATNAILDRMPAGMRQEINGLKYGYEPENKYKLLAGGKLGEMAHAAGIDRLTKAGKAVGDWTFDTTDMMDTAYRAASYLSGEQSALTKGLSPEEAGARGMALVDKVMPRWLEQTPMERSALRVAFPFYGFMSHIMRYAMRYPIDHPWRTATLGAISRAELQDFGTGLPQALANMAFVGDTGINLNAINPFHAVGDNLTVAGFLGQTNPIFKAALTQMGYNDISQGPNLYPELQYDPTTGGMKAVPMSTPSLLGQLTTGLVPQVDILAALTGTSGDFKNLMESNPDAANRMLGSSTGIPVLWRKYNLTQEKFDAELNRQTDAKTVLSQAMKTGDYSRAMQYPSLRPQIKVLQQMAASGELKAFQAGGNEQPPTAAANNQQTQQTAGQATSVAENALG